LIPKLETLETERLIIRRFALDGNPDPLPEWFQIVGILENPRTS
jgi:hypothetical protein